MTTDTITLNIDERGHSYAKIYASLLADAFQRKRAYASIVSLYSLLNLIEKNDLEIQKSMTLFRNPMINEQYEVSDIYINNYHIDVRVITDGTAFLMPKSHFDNDIQPDYYAVIKIDKSLKNAELLGFADTTKIKKEPYDYHYLSCAITELTSYNDFINEIKTKKEYNYKEEDHKIFRDNYLCLMDNEIKADTKKAILKHMFKCEECRTEFCCFTGFEMVSSSMSKFPNILEDQTLDIIGAQAVESEEYKDKEEETIYFDGNNQAKAETEAPTEDKEEISQPAEPKEDPTIEEVPEQTVSDILDELFNEEEKVETDVPEEKSVIAPTIEEATKIEENNEPEEIKIIEELKDEKEETQEKDNAKHNEIEDVVEDKETKENEALVELEEEIEETEEIEEIEETEEIAEIDDITQEKEETNIEITDENIELTDENIELIDETSELEIIKDEDTSAKSILIKDETTEEPISEIIIDKDTIQEQKDLNYIESDDITENKDDALIEIVSTEEEAPEIEAATTIQENIQKVIVDYDENGEPIYSYITNVASSEPTIEYESTDEPVELYTPEDNDEKENNTSTEEIEYKDNNEEPVEEEIIKKPSKITNKDIFGDDEEFQEDASTTEIEDIEDDEYTNFDEIDGNDEKGDETDILYNEDGYESEYDEEYEEDDDYAPENGNKKGSSKIGLLIFLFIVILGLAGGAFWFFKMNGNNILNNQINKEQTEAQNVELPQTEQQPQENQTPQNNEQPEDMFGTGIDITQTEQPQNESQESGSIDVPPLTENDLLPPTVPTIQEEKQNTNVANVMASAFTNGNVPITLRGINWLCNQSLYTDGEFKGYLQRLDNTLKLNIRKNILDITETPQNSSVTVKLAVDNNGNVLRTMISSSSGSQQIDNIVLQSINETFATEKSVILNNSAQKADKYFIQVVIKL